MFGIGKGIECPNNSYKTTFDPQNDRDKTVNDATVTIIRKDTGAVVCAETGKFTHFLYPGDYVVSAFGNDVEFHDVDFTVTDKAQTIVVSQALPTGTLSGNVKDAITNLPIFSIFGVKVYIYQDLELKAIKVTDWD